MNYTLYKGDCLEVMKKIPDGSVDMILCDLPYGTTACAWDSIIPMDALWSHYKRILRSKGAVVLTGSQPFTTTLIASNLEWFKYCWVWEKSRPGDIFNAKNKPLKSHEDVCVFSPGTTANGSPRRMVYNPQGVRDGGVSTNNPSTKAAFKAPRPSHKANYVTQGTGYPRSVLQVASEGRTVHPTQKPVALMEYLIRTYTNKGDVVMDNCMGSGTTGVSCANAGRRFIGIEMDEKYFDIASKRISDAFENRLI
ncbi:adenine-specific methyltransferase [Stenotrophomonas phage CUB19]|nr:adenine-specific methyltransferase [Stenotrophomonas phage CUB19]